MSEYVRYVGERSGEMMPCTVRVQTSDGASVPLPLRLDLRYHSPDGFQWGYGGSGPSQLALAICAHAVGDERALAIYQDFKREAIASIKDNRWSMAGGYVRLLIASLEAKQHVQS